MRIRSALIAAVLASAPALVLVGCNDDSTDSTVTIRQDGGFELEVGPQWTAELPPRFSLGEGPLTMPVGLRSGSGEDAVEIIVALVNADEPQSVEAAAEEWAGRTRGDFGDFTLSETADLTRLEAHGTNGGFIDGTPSEDRDVLLSFVTADPAAGPVWMLYCGYPSSSDADSCRDVAEAFRPLN